ncbi:MAG: hypothetical protein QOJ57_326 [Thermoleophilaceae bacterium]|nr:hypothetical protein [Thermoleophilaceae bacterium]
MRRTGLALALAAALVAAPAQAHDGSDGQRDGGHRGDGQRHHGGKSHHRFWAVRGTVVSHTLAKNDDGTYSGEVTVAAKQWNRRARHSSGFSGSDDAQTEQRTYTLDHAQVRFKVSDKSGDGETDATDVVAGDRVLLAGKSGRRCGKHGTGTADPTKVRWAAFADPKTEEKAGAKRR